MVQKQKGEKNRHDLCEDRTRALNIKKKGIVTNILRYQRPILLLFAARTKHRTRMHSSTVEERERGGDERWQTAASDKAKAVHHRLATRAWCWPLLLVLLGGVVTLFVFSACCLICKISGVRFGQNNKKTSGT